MSGPPVFTASEVLTAALMNQVTQADAWNNAVSTSVNPCVAGNLYVVTTGASALTMTLPSPTSGIVIGVKKTDSNAGGITITAGSGVVYGPGTGASGSASIPCSAQGAYVILQGDGTNWHITSGQQDSGWVAPGSLSNSWSQYSGGITIGYRITGNIVRLRGTMTGGATQTSPYTLPSGYRPTGLVCLPAANISSGASPSAAQLQIASTGVITNYYLTGTIQFGHDGATFTVD